MSNATLMALTVWLALCRAQRNARHRQDRLRDPRRRDCRQHRTFRAAFQAREVKHG